MVSLMATSLVMLTMAGGSGGLGQGVTCEDAADVPAVVRLVGSEVFLSSGRPTDRDLLSCSLTPRTVGLPTLIRLYVRQDTDGQGEYLVLRKRYEGRLRLLYDLGEQAFHFYQDLAYPDRVGSSVGRPQREWGIAAHGGSVTVVVTGVPELGARETDVKAYLVDRARALLAAYRVAPRP